MVNGSTMPLVGSLLPFFHGEKVAIKTFDFLVSFCLFNTPGLYENLRPSGIGSRIVDQMKEHLITAENLPTQREHQMLLSTYGHVKSFLNRAKEEGSFMGAHLLDHNLRVIGNTVLVADGERFRMFPPLLTSLLIDLGRNTKDSRAKNFRHGEVSMEIAKPFLEELGLNENDLNDILFAIRDHSKLNDRVEFPSYIVKTVMDADRLATLGPLSPMRAAATRPDLPLIRPDENDLQSADDQIKSIYQDVAIRHAEWFAMLWTPTAKRMAISKREFHDDYLKKLLADVSPVYQAVRESDLPLSLE